MKSRKSRKFKGTMTLQSFKLLDLMIFRLKSCEKPSKPKITDIFAKGRTAPLSESQIAPFTNARPKLASSTS